MENKTKQVFQPEILEVILNEIRTLRRDLSLVLPQEDLKNYDNPSRIKKSYQKAVKLYPPASLWR